MPQGIITTDTEWMNNNLSEYNTLSPALKSHLNDFLILWSYFEFQVLGTNANSNNIIREIESKKRKFTDPLKYNEILDFARNRYMDNSGYSNFFSNLNFRRNDNKQYVQNVLTNNLNIENNIAALLIIVFRLRNNLFHGLKWIYGFSGQDDLFYYANRLLSFVIEDINN